MVNRKLIRPNLAEMKSKLATKPPLRETPPPREGNGSSHGHSHTHPRRRLVPPDATSAEAFYYLKQMNTKTPMVVVLDDGEELRGHIEWYDRNCIKVHRPDSPNLLVFKHCIRFLYKQEEESA